jgi:hypothetical protein
MIETDIAKLVKKSGGFEHVDRKVASFVGYGLTKQSKKHQEVLVDVLATEIDGKTHYRCVATSEGKRNMGDFNYVPTIEGALAYVRWDTLE